MVLHQLNNSGAGDDPIGTGGDHFLGVFWGGDAKAHIEREIGLGFDAGEEVLELGVVGVVGTSDAQAGDDV